eukprot:278485-Amphidinium_carterae.1
MASRSCTQAQLSCEEVPSSSDSESLVLAWSQLFERVPLMTVTIHRGPKQLQAPLQFALQSIIQK